MNEEREQLILKMKQQPEAVVEDNKDKENEKEVHWCYKCEFV